MVAMGAPDSTCWTLVRGAAEGRRDDREVFSRQYAPVIRAYLSTRWQGTRHLGELDDATQEVFIDCFRDGGALERFERERPGGFRGFLYGVTRIVALRFERSSARRRAPVAADLEFDTLEADDPSLSTVFDRAWATALLREARRTQAERAQDIGDDAVRRVELLRLRVVEELPIREIARSWKVEADRLHKEYARARREFRDALFDVVSIHHPGPPGEINRQCEALIDLLG